VFDTNVATNFELADIQQWTNKFLRTIV